MKFEGETVTLETIGQETEVAGESWENQPDSPAAPPEADSQTRRTISHSMKQYGASYRVPAERSAIWNSKPYHRYEGR